MMKPASQGCAECGGSRRIIVTVADTKTGKPEQREIACPTCSPAASAKAGANYQTK